MIKRRSTALTKFLAMPVLCVWAFWAIAQSAIAADEAQDLRYGVILYHFFQQNYFDALTESLVGEQRRDLPFHQQSAKLLRGGMSLSYGMGQDAESIFTELLPTLESPEQRHQAWFYLAKLYYLRGEATAALEVLGNIDGALPKALQEEFHAMSAALLLAQGKVQAADQHIKRLADPSPWRGYYLFNRGARQTLAGDWQQGTDTFQTIIDSPLNNEEFLSLRDRAYTASGFAYLGAEQFDAAISHFKAVRLDSPLVDKAMLGYGWAAAQQQDFVTALAPWQALSERSVMDASVQESLLAIPFAYEKLAAQSSALQAYQRAIEIYEQELAKISAAITVFSDLPLVQVLSDGGGLGDDWIMTGDYLPINDQAPYLSHLIARKHFQSAVKALNDLLALQQYLQQADVRLQALQGVLDFQQAVWENNLSQSQRDDYRQRYQQLLLVRQQLQQQLARAEALPHGLLFSTAEETEWWGLIDHAQQLIEQLKQHDYEVTEQQEQLRRYKGLLLWQASEQESSRRWAFKQQLKSVNEMLEQTRQRLSRVDGLDNNRYDAEFASRVQGLQQRLLVQQAQLQVAMQQSEDDIRLLAINELDNQQQRLSHYLAQAKLAVARLLDAASVERQP